MEAQPIAKAAIADADCAAGDLKTRAQRAAAIAAAHAPAVDVAARFPAEAFAAIKAQRLLGIMVPAALGGEGARDQRGRRRVLPARPVVLLDAA